MAHFPTPSRLFLAAVAIGSIVGMGMRGGDADRSPAVDVSSAAGTPAEEGSAETFDVGPVARAGSASTSAAALGSEGSARTSAPAPATDPFAEPARRGPEGAGPEFFAPPPALSGLDPLPYLEAVRAPAAAPQQSYDPGRYHDFYFTRAVYSTGGLGRRWGGGSWAVDFPKADRQFLVVLGETLDLLNLPSRENAVRLDDPMLRRFPFLYTLEVGGMYLSPAQVEGLRSYLLAGGFLVVDDFWGAWEWRNFEDQMRRVLPGAEIVDLPLDHEIFHVFYDIQEILQVPNVNNARRGVTSECGPCRPAVRGIYDDDGRLMVVVNWNTDLGDAWEWSEQPDYPFRFSNYAYKMAVNFIVYAMTH